VTVFENGRWKIDARTEFEGFKHHKKVILTASEKKIVVAYYKMPSQIVE